MADRSSPDSRKAPSKKDRARLLARFARAQDGAAAVEFAFVAIPFLLLVFGIIELGLVFLVSLTMEAAISNADRKIRTGELQTNGGTAATYKASICNQMTWLSTYCPSALSVDVRTVTTYASTSALTKPATGKTCFDPGGPGSIVLVRAYYTWPLFTPLLQSAIGGSTGSRIVTYAAVFSNEPYNGAIAAVTCPT